MRSASLALALTCLAAMSPAQMGSPGGGETQAIALHPTNALILYAGAAKGLCKTISGGKDNWPARGLEALSPRAIVLDPADPEVLYVGTYRMGVYKSSDGSRSWLRASSGITNARIRGLVIDPRDGTTVYAGTDGGGVFKTVDGGRSWRAANRGLIDKTLRCLVGDPENPEVLYAGTWHGLYKSSDGGQSWSADPNGLYDMDVQAIAVDPSNPGFCSSQPTPAESSVPQMPGARGAGPGLCLRIESWRLRWILSGAATSTRARRRVSSAARMEGTASSRPGCNGPTGRGPWCSTPRPTPQRSTTAGRAAC